MAYISKYSTKKGDRWKFVIETGKNPQTGKRERIAKRGFLKEKDAIKAAREMEYEINKWNLDLKNKATFGDIAEEWFETYKSTGVKESTIRVRTHELSRLLPSFENIQIKDINQVMYQRFLNNQNKELAFNTLSGVHGTARMIFKYARELGIIATDPTEFARLPKTIKTVEQIESEIITDVYFEKEELKAFLDACLHYGKQGDHFIFSMLAWTGMRLGELLALKWSDVDLKNETISITKTLYNPNNNIKEFKITPPKTNGSIRVIDIEPEVIDLLKKHQLLQKQIKLVLQNSYSEQNFVVAILHPPHFGYPYYHKLVNDRMQSILKKMGTIKKHLTPHSFRHTHTSLLAETGVPLELIMERLGHDDDDTTKKVYLHVTKDSKKEASQKFGELMRNL